MSAALHQSIERAEFEAASFADEAATFQARGMNVIAHHYRRIAQRRADLAQALRAQLSLSRESFPANTSEWLSASLVAPASPSGEAGLPTEPSTV